jgi:hypothetical protein
MNPVPRFIIIDLILSIFESLTEVNFKEDLLFTYKQCHLNVLTQIEELTVEEVIENLYEIFKEQWQFMQQYKIQRKRHLKRAISDTALLLNIYDDHNARMSEFLRSLDSPKSKIQESIRSFIKLQMVCLQKEELEFPFKEEEAEGKVMKSYSLTMSNRIVVCQQFIQDLLIDLYLFIL